MLKRFLLNMLSSFVGAWLAFILVLFAGFILISSMVGNMLLSGGNTEQVKSRSILKISLDGAITETAQGGEPDIMSLMQGNMEKPQALDELVAALEEAANNKNIVGVYLDCGNVGASPATLDALRDAILKFKKSKKPVYAYADSFTLGTYYVATAADIIYLNPQGEVSINGMSSTVLYYKDLLDKLGIKMQVVKVGTFKSAVEPYIMQTMSDPARAQLDTLLGNMWGYMTREISKSRKGVTPEKINGLVNQQSIAFAPATLAVSSGLVDSLAYGRMINNKFAALTGAEPEKVNYVSPRTLVQQVPWYTAYGSKNQIAVLYATGEIVDGDPKAIDFETLVPVIVKLADDKNIKGMVLRVNSPGGSAYGSDQIGEALDYFQSKGKPLAVSMGDYAASGGYWISSGADIIYADPLTITGSIGIFGLIPNFSGLTDKLGVNPQTVATNPGANFPTLLEPMDERQLNVMQQYVDRGYEQFVGRVAKGRKMSVAAVKRIAEGRVWDAVSAQRIGLVDSLGTLKQAIEWTARKANILDKYDVGAYPQRKPGIWDMIPSEGIAAEAVQKVTAPDSEELMRRYMQKVMQQHKVRAEMPNVHIGVN